MYLLGVGDLLVEVVHALLDLEGRHETSKVLCGGGHRKGQVSEMRAGVLSTVKKASLTLEHGLVPVELWDVSDALKVDSLTDDKQLAKSRPAMAESKQSATGGGACLFGLRH